MQWMNLKLKMTLKQCLQPDLPGVEQHGGSFAPSLLDHGGGVGEDWEEEGRMEQVGEGWSWGHLTGQV